MGFLSSLKSSVTSQSPPKIHDKFNENYMKLDKHALLGEGTFASVYACQSKKTDESHAVKTFYKKRRPDPSYASEVQHCFHEEARLMQLIGKNPYCVQLLHTFEDMQFCYIVMEQCECTLQRAFVSSGPLSENDLAHVFQCMLSAVEHLHACGIVHRDVNPGNMLLPKGTSLSGKPLVKLCDFGLAVQLPSSISKRKFSFLKKGGLTDICGTVPYMAPEMLLQERPYRFGVDIWACGVTAYLMLFGDYPYRSKDARNSDLMKVAIRNGRVAPSYKACQDFPQPSATACQFVQGLLTRSPEERPDATTALTSPFFSIPPTLPDEFPVLERLPSFHDTLLLAHDALSELEPYVVPPTQLEVERALAVQDSDDQSTESGSDEDRCNIDVDDDGSLPQCLFVGRVVV